MPPLSPRSPTGSPAAEHTASRPHTPSHALPVPHAHSHTSSFTRSHTFAHSRAAPCTHALPHTFVHSPPHTHAPLHTSSLAHTLPHSHTPLHAHTQTHALLRTLPHTFSHSLTHTHTLTLPCTLPPSHTHCRPLALPPTPQRPPTKRRRDAGGAHTRRAHTMLRGTYQAGSLGPGAVLLLPLVFHVCISLRWFGGGRGRGEGGPGGREEGGRGGGPEGFRTDNDTLTPNAGAPGAGGAGAEEEEAEAGEEGGRAGSAPRRGGSADSLRDAPLRSQQCTMTSRGGMAPAPNVPPPPAAALARRPPESRARPPPSLARAAAAPLSPPGPGAAGRGPDYNSRGAARRADGASPQGREGRCRGGVAGVAWYPLAPSRALRRGSSRGPLPRPPARRAPLAALPAQPKIGARPFPAARSPRRRLLTARGSAVGPGVPGGRPPRAAGACGAPACVLPVPLAVSKLGTGAPAEEVWVQEEPVAAGLLSERGETLRSVAG